MHTLRHSAFTAIGTAVLAAITLFTTTPLASAQTGWGNALSFDGVNDYVIVPPGVWFSSEFTIEAWVYVRSYNNWSRLFDFGNGEYSDNVLLALSGGTSGRPIFQTYPSGNFVSPGNLLPLNQWVHLAATIQNNTAII